MELIVERDSEILSEAPSRPSTPSLANRYLFCTVLRHLLNEFAEGPFSPRPVLDCIYSDVCKRVIFILHYLRDLRNVFAEVSKKLEYFVSRCIHFARVIVEEHLYSCQK